MDAPSVSCSVGDDIVSDRSSWSFSGKVPAAFDEHVKRSVPLYEEGRNLIYKLSDFFVGERSFVYDIGCSTGTMISELAERHKRKTPECVGIDSEVDMITFANQRFNKPRLSYLHSSVESFEFEAADFIVSYYTIQFVRPKVRQTVVDKIFASLNWGGAFVLFEKVRACDARFQDIMTALYTEFKLENGFTPDEIFAKSNSLKGVLEPFSSNANVEMLHRAGFRDVLPIMKYVSFEGFLAIK